MLVAALVSFGVVYALCGWAGAQSGPAIMAVILTISLARRPSPARGAHAHPVLAYAVLAGVALAGAAVGLLLHAIPVAGAVVFVAAMTFAIWLRNAGERGRTFGGLIALPLVAILVAPVQARAPGGPLVDLALVIAAGAVALSVVTLQQAFLRRIGAGGEIADGAEPAARPRRERTGLSPHTRMAAQMAAALSAAFVSGLLVFPGHWAWTVLTAYIVCSGARGRGDAFYKGVLRLAGAVGGTLGAVVLAHLWSPSGVPEAALIFAALFAGLWLRELNYAYWAACMTLVLALLSRHDDGLDVALLGTRLEAILVGALCGVAAAWFVLPIRTSDVIRRRLADALVALDDLIADPQLGADERARKLATFQRRLRDLDALATPVRWHRRLTAGRSEPEHPATWIETARAFSADAHAFATGPNVAGARRGALRRAIGASRRAIGQHGKTGAEADALPVSVSLRAVHAALQPASERLE